MAESLQKGCSFAKKKEITFAKGWVQRKGLCGCGRLSPPLQCMCEHIYTFEKRTYLCKRGWQVDTPHTTTLLQGTCSIFECLEHKSTRHRPTNLCKQIASGCWCFLGYLCGSYGCFGTKCVSPCTSCTFEMVLSPHPFTTHMCSCLQLFGLGLGP